MPARFKSLLLFCLTIIWNCIKSQPNNDTNGTFPFSTTEAISTTQFFTTIDPSSGPTSAPSVSPTPSTPEPTYDPTLEGCSALKGYVQVSIDNGPYEQYSSYPVNFPPYQYQIFDELFFSISGSNSHDVDPCNISSITSAFNPADIDNKIIGIDASVSTSLSPGSCNYQQWTLNVQSMGARGVLIGVDKPFVNYDGDTHYQHLEFQPDSLIAMTCLHLQMNYNLIIMIFLSFLIVLLMLIIRPVKLFVRVHYYTLVPLQNC